MASVRSQPPGPPLVPGVFYVSLVFPLKVSQVWGKGGMWQEGRGWEKMVFTYADLSSPIIDNYYHIGYDEHSLILSNKYSRD